MKVKFVIPGEPKGKGRPRVDHHGGKTVTHTPDDTIVYENLVKTAYYQQCQRMQFPKDVPLEVRIMAYYSIPQSESKKRKAMMESHQLRPMKKPDVDNVEKVILDSLNKIAYHDDAQVVDCMFRKFYSYQPRVVVTIQEAQEVTA